MNTRPDPVPSASRVLFNPASSPAPRTAAQRGARRRPIGRRRSRAAVRQWVGVFAAGVLSVTVARASTGPTFYGVGQLPGTAAPASEVRDAVNTANGIVAVGGARLRAASPNEDTAVRWTLGGGLSALPDVVTNTGGLSFIIASAITPDGAHIIGRSRSDPTSNARVATTWAGDGTGPASLGFMASGVNFSAANGASSDASIVYGFGDNGITANTASGPVEETEPFRWDAATRTMTHLSFLNVGDTANIPAARGVSADGSVMVGTSGTNPGPAAGSRAYRYVNTAGTGTMTPLPLPDSATWSCALALTSDGTKTLGLANTATHPNGELVLWDSSTSSTTATQLGTPNPNWVPSNFGGISDDGVAAITFGDPDPNAYGTAYIHNSHGWFSIQAILASAGVDVTAWQITDVLGVSADGTLLFGQGTHNGDREGWVASFSTGYLAGITTAAMVDSLTVLKVHRYAQNGDATVGDEGTTPWEFRAEVDGNGFTINDPTAPQTVTPPSGSTAGAVSLSFRNDHEWGYRTDDGASAGYATQSALDADYANGTYAFASGTTTVNLPMTGNLYPAAPQASVTGGTWNNGVLVVDPAQPVTISTGFGTTNYLAGQSYLEIKVINTGLDVSNGSDLTTATESLTIPAGSLAPGQTYTVVLYAVRGSTVDTTSYPGAQAVAGYAAETTLQLQVPQPPPPPPQLAASTFLSNGGTERGLGVGVSGSLVYVVGTTSDNGTDGLFAGFPANFASNATANWTLPWPAASGADEFTGLAVGSEDVYAVGDSYSRTTDSSGGKENKGIAVEFALSGPLSNGGTGEMWAQQTPLAGAFTYNGTETLQGVTTAVENGTTYIYATGGGQNDASNGFRLFLSKLDAAGAIQWTQNDAASMVGEANSRGQAVGVFNGNVYVAGFDADSGTTKPYLRKYDPTGALVWSQTSPTTASHDYSGIAAVADGVVAVGSTTDGSTPSDCLVEKWDEAGNLVWSHAYDFSSGDDHLYGAVFVNGRLFAVGSSTGNSSGGADVLLVELDPATGNLMSTQHFGGANDDIGRSISSDGTNLYIAGETGSFGGTGTNLMLLRYSLVATGPTISNLSPSSAGAGQTITIMGSGFTGATSVTFNGVAATNFTVVSDNQISAVVPSGATTGLIGVVTPGGSTQSASNFVVMTGPAVSFWGVGQLAGTAAPMSQIRDVTSTATGIVAVGAARLRAGAPNEDTSVRWTPMGGLTALPDVVTNTSGLSFMTASAITPDGAHIVGRSRNDATSNARVATTWAGDGTGPVSLGFLASGVNMSAANGTSNDASIVYGFGANGITATTASGTVEELEPFRWDAASKTMTPLGLLNSGDVFNIPAARAVSTDGTVMAGTSGTTAAPGAGNHGYRYVYASGGGTMTALPNLAGGTWTAALALTPDGLKVLGVGDSTAAPNGELAIWDYSAGTTPTVTPLSSPNPAWGPSNLGGVSSDGQVAVISFGSSDPNDPGTAYLRNGNGWFDLNNVLIQAGAELSDWKITSVEGMSPDGTLLWGLGWHGGVQEGWVASFPPGYLAGANSATLDKVFVAKVHEYQQSDGSTVTEASLPWQFHASIQGSGFTSTDPVGPNAVTPPSGSTSGTVTLALKGPGERTYETEQDTSHGFGTQAALDGGFADGDYTLQTAGSSVTLPLTGGSYPDATPATVSAGTWSAGVLTVDTAQPLLVTGDYGTTNFETGRSHLELSIDGTPFRVSNGDAMTASEVTLNLPAGSLAPGQTYHVLVDKVHVAAMVTNALGWQGLTAAGGYETTSTFDVAVTGIRFDAQPQDATASSGGSVTFHAAVTATGTPTYQWQKNGADIANATGADLTLGSVQASDAGLYRVVVSNGTVSATSNTAVLIVDPTGSPPYPNGDMMDQSTVVGGAVTFNVWMLGTTPYTYQWRHAGNDIPGATNASLALTNVQLVDAGTYSVRVSNSAGYCTVGPVNLTVAAVAPPNDAFANASVISGSSAQMYGGNVGATVETGEPEHSGYSNTMPIGGHSVWWTWTAPTSGVVALDTNGSSFDTILAVYTGSSVGGLTRVGGNIGYGGGAGLTFYATAGTPYAIAVDGYYGETGQISLNLGPGTAMAPNIQYSPQPITADIGQSVALEVYAAGTFPLHYQWRQNGTDLSGATNSTLAFSSVQTSNAGDYTVVVSNDAGQATSTTATLTVNPPPLGITTQPVSQDAAVGSNVSLSVGATGSGTLTYQWQKDGTAIATGTGASLALNAVTNSDSGSYQVVVTDGTGATVTSSPATVTVVPVVTLTDQQSLDFATGQVATGPTGGDLYFSASTPQFSANNLGQRGVEPIGPSTNQLVNVLPTAGGFTRQGVPATVGNVYVSWVHGTYEYAAFRVTAVTTTSVTLEYELVASAPSTFAILMQPASARLGAGATAEFSVGAIGPAGLTYAWSKDGVALPGATDATLAIGNIQAANEGNYSVVVTSGTSSVTSADASLAVLTPTITDVSAAAVAAGQTVTITGANLSLVNGVAFNAIDASSFTVGSDSEITAVIPSGYGFTALTPLSLRTATGATVAWNGPVIAQQPTSVGVTAGQSATFTVSATGSTLTYQWRRDGVVIAGATAASYTIAATTRADEDWYDVQVGDGTQTATSQPARLTVGPTTEPQVLGVDASFNVALEHSGALLERVFPLADGGWIVSGYFDNIDGVSARGLAKFKPDGTLDTSFKPDVPVGAVYALAPLSDGKYLIGGGFTVVDSQSRTYLARLNADGTLDETFVTPALPATVIGLNQMADGSCVVITGEAFGSKLSAPAHYLLRLAPDGTVDSSYAAPELSGTPTGWLVQPDGKLVVTGSFTATTAVPRTGILRLNTDGSLDGTFDSGSGFATPPTSIAWDSGGTLVVGGNFTSYRGAPAPGIIRLNPDGSPDATFNVGTGFKGGVSAIVVDGSGRVLVGGFFFNYNGTNTSTLIRLSASGGLDTSLSPAMNGAVNSLGLAGDGSVLAAGGFTGGGSISPCLLMLGTGDAVDARGTHTWRQAVAPATIDNAPDGGVYVGGAFDYVNGTPHGGLIHLMPDGTVDSAFSPTVSAGMDLRVQADGKLLVNTGRTVLRLNPDGTADPGFVLDAGAATSISGVDLLPGGGIAVTGSFSTWAGVPASGFAVLEPSGTLNTSFMAAGSGPSGFVEVVASQPDGKVILGGFLTACDGITANDIVRLNPDGTVDRSFSTGSGFDGAVFGLQVQADGRILVGGDFTHFNGAAVPYVVRLNPDGSLDSTFNAGTDAPRRVLGFIPQPDGRIILSNQWSGSALRTGISRIFADGSFDPTLGMAPAFVTARAALLDDGRLLVSGGVWLTDPTTGTVAWHYGLLRLTSQPGPVIAQQPVSQTLAQGAPLSLSVTVVGLAAPTYQWQRNGTILNGATAASYAVPSAQSGDAGSYTVVVGGGAAPLTSAAATVTVLAPPAITGISPAGAVAGSTVTITGNGLSTATGVTFGGTAAASFTVVSDTQVTAVAPAGYTGGTIAVQLSSGAVLSSTAVAISDLPASRTVAAGADVTWRTSVQGTGPFSYQWSKDGAPLTGQTGATLQLNHVWTADAGVYTLTVSGATNAVTSPGATLTILPDDAVLWQQFTALSSEESPGRTFNAGGQVYFPWSIQDRIPDMAGGRYVGPLARFNESNGSYDPTFRLDAKYASVAHLAVQTDGKLVLAVRTGDVSTVIRTDATGAVDSTFTAPYFAHSIRFVTLQSDGKVIVAATDIPEPNAPAGSLAAAGPGIYRLNADGSVDANFTPAMLPQDAVLFGAPVVDTNGAIYLAGTFAAVDGTARANIARLNANGTLDNAYADPASLPAGFSSIQARAAVLQSDGRAVFVGDFWWSARGTLNNPVMAIRLSATGTLDTGFGMPLRSDLGLGGPRLRAALVNADDTIVAVSDRLVRLTKDGAVDPTFTSHPLERESFWVSRGSDGALYVPDNTGVVGQSASLSLVSNGVAKFGPDGTPDQSFQTGGWGRIAYPVDGAVLSDGRVWVAGEFNRFGGIAVAGLAQFAADHTLTTAAVPSTLGMTTATLAPAANDAVYAVLGPPADSYDTTPPALVRVLANGAIDGTFAPVLPGNYDLYSASLHAAPNGAVLLAQPAITPQAALSGNTGSALLLLSASGAPDTSYTAALSSIAAVDRDSSNAVTMIRTGGLNVAQVLPDGRALVVVSSIDGTLRLLRLTASGAVDGTFNAPSLGTIAPEVGYTVPLTDPTTGTTAQFNLSTYNASDLVRAAVQMPDGKVYVGGRLTLSGAPRGLVRLNGDGTVDSTFTGAGIANANAAAGPYVDSLAVDGAGRLYVGGRFDSFDGTPEPGLFRLAADGTLDTAWTPGIAVVDKPSAAVHLTVSGTTLYAFGTVGSASATLPQAWAAVAIPTPVVITQQPASQTVNAGTAVTLSVAATGDPAPTYQWRKNGLNIADATAATLTIASVQTSNAGDYTVVVSNGAGSVVSSVATLTVNAPATAPSITTQPLSQTVTAGADVTFTIAATGDPTPTYQWLKNGSVINGATTATLALTNVQTTDSANYSVLVANSGGSVTSAPAALTVNAATSGATANVAVSGPALYTSTGGTLTLQASASYAGQTPTSLSFTVTLPSGWSFTSMGSGDVVGSTPAAGATGTLTFTYGTIPTDQAGFMFTVTYPAGLSGSQTITASASDSGVALPIADLVLAQVSPPTIASQPVGATAIVGGGVTFTVSATSGASVTYQWQKDGSDLSGATNSSLSLSNLQMTDAGNYTVVVSNLAGPVSSTAAPLTVFDVSATHAVLGGGYIPGSTVTITSTLNYTGTSSGPGWQVLIPSGWSYASGTTASGMVTPGAGTTDLLEWAWTNSPPSPITFSYTLNVPAGATGDQTLSALVIFRSNGQAVQFLAQPDPLVVHQVTTHSADENKDFAIDLFELTRVIELYNTRNGTNRTGAYAVATTTTEDGFTQDAARAPNTVATLSRYHSADENHDGMIDLFELTRVIELYNYRSGTNRTGQYHVQAGTEDGFAPGP